MTSQFWGATETAGPTPMDVMRVWDRQPRFLRPHNRTRPPPFQASQTLVPIPAPTLLGPSHMGTIAAFWREHYGGTDWVLDASVSWVRTQLSVPGTITLGVMGGEGGEGGEGLIGTVVGRPVGSSVAIGTKGRERDMYVIEGLCIHRKYRGKHLAGWLIAWIDYYVSRNGPQVMVWARETGTFDASVTHISANIYGYIRCEDAAKHRAAASITRVPWSEFLDVWDTSSPAWDRSNAVFPTSLRVASHVPLDVWRCTVSGLVIVVSDTGRRTRGGIDGSQTIWEVVWMGVWKREGALVPLTESHPQSRPVLEAIAANISEDSGLLFATDAAHQGGIHRSWAPEWHVGTSGYHMTYLYNYMPPCFWKCRYMLPRIDI